MTLEDQVKKHIGELTVQVIGLQLQLEAAQARLAELEETAPQAETAPKLYAAG